MPCNHQYEFRPYCGVDVCIECDHHLGMVRCYCGWAESGRNGRDELKEMGEIVEEEEV